MVDTQLIAHDREVYDMAWGGLAIFATVAADGSVRVFDLRWASLGWLRGARAGRVARAVLASPQDRGCFGPCQARGRTVEC
jgi:hypothetical protein